MRGLIGVVALSLAAGSSRHDDPNDRVVTGRQRLVGTGCRRVLMKADGGEICPATVRVLGLRYCHGVEFARTGKVVNLGSGCRPPAARDGNMGFGIYFHEDDQGVAYEIACDDANVGRLSDWNSIRAACAARDGGR